MKPRITTITILAVALFVTTAGACLAAPAVRVKDLSRIEGVRSNPIIGYGLVVGLQGTGDGTQAAFTIQSLANVLRRSGVSVPQSSVRVRNVAAVMVTADLPPFTRPGQTLDAQVSSIGDAKSLQGGVLLMTPMYGPDGAIYAVAQGAVSIGGAFLGGGGGNAVQKNHPTSGRIPAGAVVEREVPTSLDTSSSFRLLLNEPDFATASRVAVAVNEALGASVARAEDPTGIRIYPPESYKSDPVGLLARVQAVEVRPDNVARVVINERTGTVVMGADVRISRIALAHGNLNVEIRTDFEASQPAPFSESGETVVLPEREVFVAEGPNSILTLEEGVSVGEVVESLNALGVTSRDMIAIFQAMRAAGALHAELVIL
jgi:flagellar P-ring protein precursor FlgI